MDRLQRGAVVDVFMVQATSVRVQSRSRPCSKHQLIAWITQIAKAGVATRVWLAAGGNLGVRGPSRPQAVGRPSWFVGRNLRRSGS